ncbi:hypothetical protein M9H77_35251 [Catharanthus roseus]|uniref:Uncharacterized protein n=1 Tax=Catharanthus roseus TaxID=4058 RepID=A0ACB9ZPQ4_CATRO|nr:hypothetical protein M9H77_35251 [Catharanthus roseus]
MAAASATMQSFIVGTGSPASGFSNRNGLNYQLSYVPPVFHKRANLRLRSMAQDDEKEISAPTNPIQGASEPLKSQTNPQPISNPKPKVSTRFEDVLAFSGPGPERINGRLAMIGFVTAIGVELAKGQDLFSQIGDGGFTWFLGTSVLLTLASLVPLFKGVRAEAKSQGLMTSDAELWNGRFAMLGLVALAFTEYLKGGALV